MASSAVNLTLHLGIPSPVQAPPFIQQPPSTTVNQVQKHLIAAKRKDCCHLACRTAQRVQYSSINMSASQPVELPPAPSSLPPEAIALATRMYNAARQGDADLLQQAITAGLPPNLTNEKGDTLVWVALNSRWSHST